MGCTSWWCWGGLAGNSEELQRLYQLRDNLTCVTEGCRKGPTQIAKCKATFILYVWGGLPTTTSIGFTASNVQQTSENLKWSLPEVKCEQHCKPTYQLSQHLAGLVSPSWRTHLTKWRTPQSFSILGSRQLRPKDMTVTFIVCFTVHQSAMLGDLKPPGSILWEHSGPTDMSWHLPTSVLVARSTSRLAK